MKKEEQEDPNIERMRRYFNAKQAGVLAEAGDAEGSTKALETLVGTIVTGEDGESLVNYLRESGEQGNAHLINCYSRGYEGARSRLTTGVLLEKVYGEQLKSVLGDKRYAVAEKVFGEYADTTYGDLREKIKATEAKVENLKTQGKKEEAKKLEKELGEMKKVLTAIEGIEQLRVLDPTTQLKTQLTALFEPEQEAEPVAEVA